MEPPKLSIEEMYDGSYEGYEAILNQSLNPRSPDVLYEKFNALGPTHEGLVLDLGSRNAAQASIPAHYFAKS